MVELQSQLQHGETASAWLLLTSHPHGFVKNYQNGHSHWKISQVTYCLCSYQSSKTCNKILHKYLIYAYSVNTKEPLQDRKIHLPAKQHLILFAKAVVQKSKWKVAFSLVLKQDQLPLLVKAGCIQPNIHPTCCALFPPFNKTIFPYKCSAVSALQQSICNDLQTKHHFYDANRKKKSKCDFKTN